MVLRATYGFFNWDLTARCMVWYVVKLYGRLSLSGKAFLSARSYGGFTKLAATASQSHNII